MDKDTIRFCLTCEQELSGRADKKFCDDECRNYFHNQRNQGLTQLFRRIETRLRSNRKILAKLHHKQMVNKDGLLGLNFDFNHFTHLRSDKKGKNYFFCYDHGYLVDDQGHVRIVKSEDEFPRDS